MDQEEFMEKYNFTNNLLHDKLQRIADRTAQMALAKTANPGNPLHDALIQQQNSALDALDNLEKRLDEFLGGKK